MHKIICMRSLLGKVLILAAFSTTADEQKSANKDGRDLAAAIENRDLGYKNSRAEMLMTIANSSGKTTERSLIVELLEVPHGGDQSKLTFEFPADVRGTALLSHPQLKGDDDQWLYMPSINRVKRISSRNKSGAFVGSEFSFEDLSDKSVDDFTYQYLGTSECFLDIANSGKVESTMATCDKLERIPRDKNTGYSKQVLTVEPNALRIVAIDYFDVRGQLLKRLESEQFKLFEGKYWRPLKVSMHNVQTQKTTTLEYKSLDFQVNLHDRDFSRATLGR